MVTVPFDELVDLIVEGSRGAAANVVAIDGPSGSGKSTLAARLATRLPESSVVPLDDFNSWADPVGDTWWLRFEAQMLEPAFAGRAMRYQQRDWIGDELGVGLASWRNVAASRFVIAEGVSSARNSVRRRGAFAIWVEAPLEVRHARAISRDGEQRRTQWETWMAAEQDFFEADGTKAAADLRIDGAPSELHDPEEAVVLL